jgi:Cu(I)/Ag(I) efflux system membrane fusion protein
MKIRILILVLLLSLFTLSSFSQQQAEPQTAKVLITKNGFEPNNLKLKVNVPAKVTFLRQTNDTCATSIVIPEYKIKKEVPLNQSVVVEFKPTKTGKFSFVCGMQMLKGDLVVTEQ